jgi:hypothetical protein
MHIHKAITAPKPPGRNIARNAINAPANPPNVAQRPVRHNAELRGSSMYNGNRTSTQTGNAMTAIISNGPPATDISFPGRNDVEPA